MALYAIADLHLSFGADKPMDVFRGWENYTDKLSKNWNKLITESDTVVIAGDISWAMKLEETRNDFDFLHSLPGKKLLLKGNHDYWWSTRSKMDKYLTENSYDDISIIHNSAFIVGDAAVCGTRGWMYNSESEEDLKIVNREAGRLSASIIEAEKAGVRPIVFLHYPPVYDVFVCRQIVDVMHEHNIEECYFGHIHGKDASKRALTGTFEGISMKLISCDHINFCPQIVIK